MTIEAQKLEVINRIALLQDTLLLARVKQILDKSEIRPSLPKLRQAGWGKGIFTFIADDFNDTPEGFEDYMPQK
jgi:hypothetical protein